MCRREGCGRAKGGIGDDDEGVGEAKDEVEECGRVCERDV